MYLFQSIAGKVPPTPMNMLDLRRRRPLRRSIGHHPQVRRPLIRMMRTMLGRKRKTLPLGASLDSQNRAPERCPCLRSGDLLSLLSVVATPPWRYLSAGIAPLKILRPWGLVHTLSFDGIFTSMRWWLTLRILGSILTCSRISTLASPVVVDLLLTNTWILSSCVVGIKTSGSRVGRPELCV